jgi:nucleoside-diphosphate-sugar epimerase
MTEHNKTALVVGATGVVGIKLVEELRSQGDWQIIGLSQRGHDDGPRTRYIAVDLLDIDDTRAKLAELSDVTHIFLPGSSNVPRGRTWLGQTSLCWSTSST